MHTPDRPYPGSRIVDRVAVGGELPPWPSNTVRYIRRSWRGPVHIDLEGVDFNIRYVASHEHVRSGVYPLHTHPHAELLLTLAGRGRLFDAGSDRVFACEPGTAVVMAPQRAHRTDWRLSRGMWQMLLVDFDLAIELGRLPLEAGEQVDLAFSPFYEWFFIRQEPALILRPAERTPAIETARDTIDALAPGTYGVCSEVVAGVLRIIALLSRSLKEQELAEGRHLVAPVFSKEAALLKARTLMEHRGLFDPGCVRRVARTVGMSESHFVREFHKAYGVTPKRYSQQVLMRRACGILAGTDLPVRAVADRLGYDDASTFSRAFRRLVGVSPERYRAQHPVASR